jgi:hypothetical protein
MFGRLTFHSTMTFDSTCCCYEVLVDADVNSIVSSRNFVSLRDAGSVAAFFREGHVAFTNLNVSASPDLARAGLAVRHRVGEDVVDQMIVPILRSVSSRQRSRSDKQLRLPLKLH